jgi:hypothetical protein
VKKVVGGQYMIKWFSNQCGDNPKMFYEQKDQDTMELDQSMLVHHFDKLTGNRKTQGQIPDVAMKVIKQVVADGNDALCNGDTRCTGCQEDLDGSGDVQCTLCNKWWHAQCLGTQPEADGDGVWLCRTCSSPPTNLR